QCVARQTTCAAVTEFWQSTCKAAGLDDQLTCEPPGRSVLTPPEPWKNSVPVSESPALLTLVESVTVMLLVPSKGWPLIVRTASRLVAATAVAVLSSLVEP